MFNPKPWGIRLALLGSLSLLGGFSSQAYCATSTEQSQVLQIFQQLSATPLVRANFEQKKQLAALNKTFVSKGTILFSKNQGVLWGIQQPVQANLIVTPQKIVQKTQRTHSQIEVGNSPYASVATMFLQLMAGDRSALEQNFNVVSARYTPTQWNVALTPKSNLFKKLFVRVEAQGQQFVNRLVITEKDNSTTTILFSQQSVQPQTLTAAEHALFQLAK